MNQLRDEAYQNAVEHGFHDSDTEISRTSEGFHALLAQRLALIHSEISEVLEADRKGRESEIYAFYHDKKKDFIDRFNSYIKDTIEDELADAIIRILDLCGWLKIDIGSHVELKMQYNKERVKKHGKNY